MRMSKLPRPVARLAVALRRTFGSLSPDVRQMVMPSLLALATVAAFVTVVSLRKERLPGDILETVASAPAEVSDHSPGSIAPAEASPDREGEVAVAATPTMPDAVAARPAAITFEMPPEPAEAAMPSSTSASAPADDATTAAPRVTFEMPPEPDDGAAAAAATDASVASAGPAAPAALAPSFDDDRAPPSMIKFEMPPESHDASAPAPAVLPPSFHDDRALADTPAVDRATAPGSAAGAAPSFVDERPIAETAASAVPPLAFRDDRRLTTPSFEDNRLVATPSFVDPRPAASVSFHDERPMAGMAGDTPTPLAGQEPHAVAPPVAAAPPVSGPSEAAAAAAGAAQQVAALAQPPASPAPSGPLPTLVALAPGQLKIDGAACTAPELETEPLDGGTMRLAINAPCHPNEFVQISYGGAELIRKLNANGILDFILDCFAGTSSAVEVRFADGLSRTVPVVAKDLDKVSKIAVVWRAGVNLDLHVFEYAAAFDQPGHLWARVPSSFGSARIDSASDGRGHGYLSSADDEKPLGDKLEVYTFLHNDQQASGSISLALDNESRGEVPSGATCGQGALAEIAFHVSILPRSGQVSRQSGVLTRVDCGTRLTHQARFNQSAMPGLRIRK